MGPITRIGAVLGLVVVLLVAPQALAQSAVVRSGYLPVRLGGSSPDVVVVAPGDHLWAISERHLEAGLGRRPDDEEVAPYWRSVIELNRNHLRSGDPDLIYPGEEILLPAPG